MRKLVLFNNDQAKQIKNYAVKYYEGNFNQAVRQLCIAGLKANKLKKDKENGNVK